MVFEIPFQSGVFSFWRHYPYADVLKADDFISLLVQNIRSLVTWAPTPIWPNTSGSWTFHPTAKACCIRPYVVYQYTPSSRDGTRIGVAHVDNGRWLIAVSWRHVTGTNTSHLSPNIWVWVGEGYVFLGTEWEIWETDASIDVPALWTFWILKGIV